MLNRNNLFTGILAALLFPAIAWTVAYYLRNEVTIINRPAMPYLIAIALNLIMIRFALKKDLDQTSRGIMLTTFIVMFLVLFFKSHLIR